jgi:hypothetical protein
MGHGVESSRVIRAIPTCAGTSSPRQLRPRQALRPTFRNWYVCPYEGPHKENCLGYPSEKDIVYNTGTYAGAVANYDPVCGNVHLPPNARGQYDAANPATVRTSCANYRDGSGRTMAFTTQEFARYATVAPDCMGAWLVWWYQNFPGLDNASRDDAGNAMLNWWPFLFY